MISPAKLEQAERFLARYETGGVFFARLLPVIRHLIGIPAGIVRMPIGPYSVWTIVGSAVWCTVLAVFGKQVLGDRPDLMSNPSAVIDALKGKSHIVAAGVLVLAVLYVAVMRITRKPTPATPS
jgi:membrane protein DedA with SNARE-associated domain